MSPVFESFAHYLAYGATDQETFRELRDSYNGILVPATIAAFQRQGTGGFVLSLSATPEAPPYLIDPRFPLFQQALKAPKKSHTALAALLGDADLVVTKADPFPVEFPDHRVAAIAEAWVAFNQGYGVKENEKFDKYAKRLGEDVRPEAAQGPEAVLAPYFACRGPEDPWWDRSQRFFEATAAATATAGVPCLRVVCGPDARSVGELLDDLSDPEQLVVWASGLDEHNAPVADLIDYRRAIATGAEAGHDMFALYGGFFSVLLGAVGLTGASHGVGFSEHRSWRELPSSGAPPPRYYLRRAHRYVPQDLAQALYNIDPTLTKCTCDHCAGRPPVALDYHELMKHSVVCRKEEIDRWTEFDNSDAAAILRDEHDALSLQISEAILPPRIRARADAAIEHMPSWVTALTAEL
jgi:hypothetical protein